MERSHAFETVLVLILIGLIGLVFFMIVSTPQQAQSWEMQGNGSVDYMFTGSDDTLYVFRGNNVTAIESDGRVAWSLHVPDEWRLSTIPESWGHVPVVGENDGRLYLYLSQPSSLKESAPIIPVDPWSTYKGCTISAKVMAISPDGTVSWEYPFTAGVRSWTNGLDSGYRLSDDVVIRPYENRVMVYHDNKENVLDDDGKFLFNIGNISGPVAVDSGGHMYAVEAVKPDIRVNAPVDYSNWTDMQQLMADPRFEEEDYQRIVYDPSYMIKTSIIEGFDHDGTLLWSRDIGEKVLYTYENSGLSIPEFGTVPLCVKDTLYVAVHNGTAAIGTDGSLKWVTHLSGGDFTPFVELPVDDSGNVYMWSNSDPGGYRYIHRINADGTVARDAWNYDLEDVAYTAPAARSDGTIYVITNSSMFPFQAFNDTERGGQMSINTLTANDIGERRKLWSFTVPAEDVRRVTLNASNVEKVMPDSDILFNVKMNEEPGFYGGLPADERVILPTQYHRITINPGKNVIYMSYYSIMYESPVIFNRSRAVYVNSLYALDNNGTLLWKQHMDEYVTHAVARNDTFYYSTNSGRIGGNTVNVAAGIALIAAAYIFLRFFILGTVARARTKIESNRNRNDLLKFINENPGVTAVDISRGMKMNLGTIRYHLFILAANHKIVSYKDDGKFLRYFRNSGAYSPEDRSWLSLMRREPIRKVLAALERNPGQSLQELARELDMSPTAVHNHISELSARGIVNRAQGGDRGYAYVIKEEYRPLVVRTMQRL
ncbi:MAG TPA: winged helix-turn-helix transcriptional regulator [Methanocella sp.]|jgi:predicted transcriptional regulator